MIVLVLGSNVGDCLAHLRNALHAIKQIAKLSVQQVSPVYISDALLPENAPADWDMPYFNVGIRVETTLQPLELLTQLKQIEWSIGRKPEIRHWGPRILDIDILAWDDLIIESDALTIPHQHLHERPFALWPLADVAPYWIYPRKSPYQGKTAEQLVEVWGSRFSGDAPWHTKQIYQRIDTPQLVGVVNITPDSCSDGGKFLQPEKAIEQALALVNAGADIIDLGAESTRPNGIFCDAHIEWSRLEPVLAALTTAKSQLFIPPKISIDTRYAETAAKALSFGVDWINDVTGLDDSAMRDLIAQANVDCVVMHHLSIPERRDHVLPRNQDPVKLVYAWAEKRLQELEQQGIVKERIIFDPGIGFGKMAEQSLTLVKNVAAFNQLGNRMLVGPSRKSFLSLFTHYPYPERDIETLAIIMYLAKQPVNYLRVHDAELCARVLRVNAAL